MLNVQVDEEKHAANEDRQGIFQVGDWPIHYGEVPELSF